MHDRTSFLNESPDSEQRKYDHLSWVNKYLDLADTALREKKEEQEQAA